MYKKGSNEKNIKLTVFLNTEMGKIYLVNSDHILSFSTSSFMYNPLLLNLLTKITIFFSVFISSLVFISVVKVFMVLSLVKN